MSGKPLCIPVLGTEGLFLILHKYFQVNNHIK